MRTIPSDDSRRRPARCACIVPGMGEFPSTHPGTSFQVLGAEHRVSGGARRDRIGRFRSVCAQPMRLTSPYCCVNLPPYASERGFLIEILQTAKERVSGLMLESSRLLAPPIHPRVPTSVALPSPRLITRAGRGVALRSA